MYRPRKLGQWIALVLGAASGCCLLASIFLDGDLSIKILVIGAALFLPAAVCFAKQFYEKPVTKVNKSVNKYEPSFSVGAFRLLIWLIWLGLFFSPSRSSTHVLDSHHVELIVTAVIWIALGGFDLVTALGKRQRAAVRS